MGKGAFIRIQNKSTFDLDVTIQDRHEVEDRGIAEIQGHLVPGAQLPVSEGQAVENKGSYQYIKGETKTFLQKDGSIQVVVASEGQPAAMLKLCVDANKWWAEPEEDDFQAALKITTSIQGVDSQYKIDVSVYNAYHGNSWMGDLASEISSIPFSEVCLPGTHDSATYQFHDDLGASPDSDLTMAIQEKLVVNNGESGEGKLGFLGKLGAVIGSTINNTALGLIFEKICKAQSLSVKEQLTSGIRYLDLRVVYHQDSDQYYSCHGVYCVNMKTIIQDVNAFLTANPKEIVIMDFNHLYKMDGYHEAFVNDLLTILGDRAADSSQLKPSSTLEEFWNTNAQAVILYQHGPSVESSGGKLWSQDHIHSPWPETHDIGLLETKLLDNVKSRSVDQFFVLQGILTPDGDLIKEELLVSNLCMSLASIASRVSPKVVEWVEEWKCEKHNVVIVDHFHECALVSLVINMNRKI